MRWTRKQLIGAAVVMSVMSSAYAADIPIPPLEEEIMKLRDPFKRPDVALRSETMTELETIPLDKFKMIGAVTGPKQGKAMLVNDDGRTFYVGEKTKIGVRNGVVKKITSRAVLVEEKIVNVLGQEEVMTTEIKLQDSKPEESAGKPRGRM